MQLNSKNVMLVVLGFLVIYTILPWLQQGVPATDDFRHHVTKFWFLKDSIQKTGKVHEWVPYIFGGWPLAHYYHSLPYYASLPLIIFLNPVTALKWSIVFSLAAAAITMFIAARIYSGKDSIALVAAALYTYAPIHFEFAYLSGSISRMWGHIFFAPALLLFLTAVLKNQNTDENKNGKKYYFWAGISYALLVLTNINMAFTVGIFWTFIIIYRLISDIRSLEGIVAIVQGKQSGESSKSGESGEFAIHDVDEDEAQRTAAKDSKDSIKSNIKELGKGIGLIALIVFGLTAYWLIPLYIESYESTTVSYVGTGLFGNSPSPTALGIFVARQFGFDSAGARHFYIGFFGLALAMFAIFFSKNLEHKWLFLFLILAGFAIASSGFILNHIPLSRMSQYSIYYMLDSMVFAYLIAGFAITAIANFSKKHYWIIFAVLLTIALADVIPAARTYRWVNLPDWMLYNPPQIIQAWSFVGQQPGDFRVYSIIGEVPYMYHGKQEVGTVWMGYRDGALKYIRQAADDIEYGFTGSKAQSESIANALGYMSAKLLVLPCGDYPEFYKQEYNQNGVCVYSNKFYGPIVDGVNRIVKANVSVNEFSFANTDAIVSEDCKVSCITDVEPAVISDVAITFDKISFNAKADEKGYAIVKSTYFRPHWKAYSDGKEVSIQEVWPKFMLIEVPSGEHKIELRYVTNATHTVSTAITIATIFGIIGYLFLQSRKKKENKDNTTSKTDKIANDTDAQNGLLEQP